MALRLRAARSGGPRPSKKKSSLKMGLALHLTARLRWPRGRTRGRSLSTTQQPPPPLPAPTRGLGRPSALTSRSRSLRGPAWYSAESRSCPPRGPRRSTLSLVGCSWRHKKSRWKSGGVGGPARRGAYGLVSAELASSGDSECGRGGRRRPGPGRGEPKGEESGDDAVSLSGALHRRRSGAEACSRAWVGGNPPAGAGCGGWNSDSRRRVCGLSGRKAQPSRPARCGSEQTEGRQRPARASAAPGSGSRGGMKNCGMRSGVRTLGQARARGPWERRLEKRLEGAHQALGSAVLTLQPAFSKSHMRWVGVWKSKFRGAERVQIQAWEELVWSGEKRSQSRMMMRTHPGWTDVAPFSPGPRGDRAPA